MHNEEFFSERKTKIKPLVHSQASQHLQNKQKDFTKMKLWTLSFKKENKRKLLMQMLSTKKFLEAEKKNEASKFKIEFTVIPHTALYMKNNNSVNKKGKFVIEDWGKFSFLKNIYHLFWGWVSNCATKVNGAQGKVSKMPHFSFILIRINWILRTLIKPLNLLVGTMGWSIGTRRPPPDQNSTQFFKTKNLIFFTKNIENFSQNHWFSLKTK